MCYSFCKWMMMAQFIQVKQNWHLQCIRARIWLSSQNVFLVNEFLDFIFCYGEWQMQHFCRSMTIHKNTPIFTSWLIIKVYIMTCSAVSFIWCCICMYQAQFIEDHKGFILYNCTSRWSCMYVMSVHYHPKGRDQIRYIDLSEEFLFFLGVRLWAEARLPQISQILFLLFLFDSHQYGRDT